MVICLLDRSNQRGKGVLTTPLINNITITPITLLSHFSSSLILDLCINIDIVIVNLQLNILCCQTNNGLICCLLNCAARIHRRGRRLQTPAVQGPAAGAPYQRFSVNQILKIFAIYIKISLKQRIKYSHLRNLTVDTYIKLIRLHDRTKVLQELSNNIIASRETYLLIFDFTLFVSIGRIGTIVL